MVLCGECATRQEVGGTQVCTAASPFMVGFLPALLQVAAAASGEGGTAEVAAAVQRVAQLRGVKLPQQQQQQLP